MGQAVCYLGKLRAVAWAGTGQPGRHLMAALLGCDRVVAWANVMEPIADRRRADSTDVEDTQEPESCSTARMSVHGEMPIYLKSLVLPCHAFCLRLDS
jgi:hypothetical protein